MYNEIARYYDAVHAELTADLPLIIALATAQGGRAVELGSGTGRVLLPLATAGISVVGVDNAAEMVAIAQKRLATAEPAIRNRISLITQDITRLHLDTPTPFAFAAHNTAMHLAAQQWVPTLRTLAKNCTPTAQLFLDLANPFAIAAMPDDTSWSCEHTWHDEAQAGEKVSQWAQYHVDTLTQTMLVKWQYRRTSAPKRPLTTQTVYHYYYPHEIEAFMRHAGWRLLSLWGNYGREPFTEDSPRLLVLATKQTRKRPA